MSAGARNTLFEGNISHHNGGEGLDAYSGPGGATFRHNVCFDNWSVNLYVDNVPNVKVEGNLIY